MPPIVSSTAAMSDWHAMLDRIDESVNEALREMALREQEVGDETDAASIVDPNPDQIQQRLTGLETRFAKARVLAGEIEAMLARDEREVQAWRDAAANSRQRLATAERL